MTTPAQGNLGLWLLAAESSDRSTPEALAAAAERVSEKLFAQVARLVALEGSRALFARALYLANSRFPFLSAVYVDNAPEQLLGGLREAVHGVEPAQISAGLAAVFSGVLGLLATFIGDDLTVRLLRDPWPDAPYDALESGAGDV